MKNNKKLRQISNSRNIRIYTIPNNGLVQISKALKQIIERNLTPSNLTEKVEGSLLSLNLKSQEVAKGSSKK